MDLFEARRLAVDLARQAGDLAVERRDEATATSKGAAGDVVTVVDHDAERMIAAALRHAYPQHAVLGEEFGLSGDPGADYRWLVDPLDGTNNYVLGIDLFGVCITLCRGDEPMVAVTHDSTRRRTFSAVKGAGTFADGELVHMIEPPTLAHATISWLQGYAVGGDDPIAEPMFRALDRGCRRALRTWAPSIDWGLLATGKVAALVAHRNESWDLVGGSLIAVEAGAESWTSADGKTVLVGHPAVMSDVAWLIGLGTHLGE